MRINCLRDIRCWNRHRAASRRRFAVTGLPGSGRSRPAGAGQTETQPTGGDPKKRVAFLSKLPLPGPSRPASRVELAASDEMCAESSSGSLKCSGMRVLTVESRMAATVVTPRMVASRQCPVARVMPRYRPLRHHCQRQRIILLPAGRALESDRGCTVRHPGASSSATPSAEKPCCHSR